jgi:hypothetical protein
MVFGDVYDPETEDFDGNPMVIKSGVDKGKPTQLYVIGLAIPKTAQHWASEPGWGQTIWATGHQHKPGDASKDSFSWKIYDGDSQKIPDKSKSKVRPCDREGWAGHWVLRLQSSFAPSVFNGIDNPSDPVPVHDVGFIKPGYVIEVPCTVRGNTGQSPGVYLNHRAVALRAYMPVINTGGFDPKGKFGGAVGIAGASKLPVGGAAIPAAPATAAPAAPPAPAAPAYVAPAAPAAPAAPTAVQPAPALVGIPAAPPPPPAPAPVPSKPTWASLAPTWGPGGWTEESARAAGHCL